MERFLSSRLLVITQLSNDKRKAEKKSTVCLCHSLYPERFFGLIIGAQLLDISSGIILSASGKICWAEDKTARDGIRNQPQDQISRESESKRSHLWLVPQVKEVSRNLRNVSCDLVPNRLSVSGLILIMNSFSCRLVPSHVKCRLVPSHVKCRLVPSHVKCRLLREYDQRFQVPGLINSFGNLG